LPPLLRRECGNAAPGERPRLPESPEELKEAVLKDPHGTLNRLLDQQRVQGHLGLREVGDSTTVLRERQGAQGPPGPVLAVGYERVLYGDGGAYIELHSSQIRWRSWPHFRDKSDYDQSYYDEYFTARSYSSWVERWDSWNPRHNEGILMLYAQRYTVDDRPYAPGAAWQPHTARQGGYADYRPGYFYITADGALISAHEGEDEPPLCEPPPPEEAGTAASLRSGTQGGAWESCWEWQAGKCSRGFMCKWRHV
jgi:hypothetical protein